MPGYHPMAAVNRAPGFGWGMALSSAFPMQVGMLQVGTPAISPRKTPAHGTTAEEMLLQGSMLLCSPQQEISLLSPPPLLTDNHLKMMESLHTLDAWGLQFICELIEAVWRERMLVWLPLGYTTPQVMDRLQVPLTNSPMSQELLWAASNMGTTITSTTSITRMALFAGPQPPSRPNHRRCCKVHECIPDAVHWQPTITWAWPLPPPVQPQHDRLPQCSTLHHCMPWLTKTLRKSGHIEDRRHRRRLIDHTILSYFNIPYVFLYSCTVCIVLQVIFQVPYK